MLFESRHLRMLLQSVALSAGVKSKETSGAPTVKSSYNLGEEDQPLFRERALFFSVQMLWFSF